MENGERKEKNHNLISNQIKMLPFRLLHVLVALLCLVAMTVGRPVEPTPAGYIVLEDSVSDRGYG